MFDFLQMAYCRRLFKILKCKPLQSNLDYNLCNILNED